MDGVGSMPKSTLRNLAPEEIVGQLLALKKVLNDFGPRKYGISAEQRECVLSSCSCLCVGRESVPPRIRSVVMVRKIGGIEESQMLISHSK